MVVIWGSPWGWAWGWNEGGNKDGHGLIMSMGMGGHGGKRGPEWRMGLRISKGLITWVLFNRFFFRKLYTRPSPLKRENFFTTFTFSY